MTAQWFEKRFTESANKLRVDCSECSRPMFFPPSKAGKYLTCGEKCAAARRAGLASQKQRACLTCGSCFIARADRIASGGGKYCSNACAAPTRAAGRTAEAAQKRGAARRAAFAAGTWAPLRGAANGRWKGGRAAYRERQRLVDPAQRAAKRRAYLALNPERAREWSRRRQSRKVGRLPRGTVNRIGAAQRWKCAACIRPLRGKYHIDHIMPLALDGEHEASNIQLLCPPCNVRKSAKHPIAFMQERGYLL